MDYERECPRCYELNRPGSLVCVECGTRLVALESEIAEASAWNTSG